MQEWLCFKNIPLKIGSREWKHITLDEICFLYAIENPLVKTSCKREITLIDLIIFLYVTQSPDFQQSELRTLTAKSGAWYNSAGMDYDEAVTAVDKILSLAFQPMDFFPPSTSEQLVGKKETAFDSDWCAAMISAVHQMTGLLPEQILKMPVATCGWYFLQFAKQQGTKNLERKSNAEIIYEMDIRCNEMIVQRLIEKGIIKEEERDYYLECLKSPSKRRKDFTVKKS